MATHHVRRANFRLKMPQAPDAAQRQHWQHEFEHRYLPLLDKALVLWLAERPHLHNRMVHIPSMQLDLGRLDADPDEQTLVRLLQHQLDRNLPSLLGMDTDSWRLHCYLHFLQHGTWPIGNTLLQIADVETWLLEHPHVGLRLLGHLQQHVQDNTLWQRMLQQHTAYFLEWLAARTPYSFPAEVGVALDNLAAHPGFRAVFTSWLGLWWQRRGKTLFHAQPHQQLALHAVLNDATNHPADPALLAQLIYRIEKLGDADVLEPHEDSALDLAKNTDQLEAGVLVQQAGVILLHPFLPRLFHTLGLLDSGHFRNAHCRLQALFALHYIVSGLQHADESELALHKFLVNWPLHRPVPAALTLDAGQYAEIDHMLSTAIGQWSVLRHTSIAGLRETFLQRSGSLQKHDEGCRLAVAGRSVDILLAQLPWSLNVVTLPWLAKPLFVCWGPP